jgi:hypothetical protein
VGNPGAVAHALAQMGQTQPRELYPSGALKQSKGVSYHEDGRVASSLFQRIADGEVLPGRDSGNGDDAGDASEDVPRVLLHADDWCVAFVPLNAASALHVLVVPRAPGARFIRTVDDTGPGDVELLEHLRRVGQQVLDRRVAQQQQPQQQQQEKQHLGESTTKKNEATGLAVAHSVTVATPVPAVFLFHRPPFNSIDHLHLHCLGGGRRRRPLDWAKYPPCDAPWAASLDTILAQLRRSSLALSPADLQTR